MTARRITYTVLGLMLIGLGVAGAFYIGKHGKQLGLGDLLSMSGLKSASTGQSVVAKKADAGKSGTGLTTQRELLIQSYMLALAQANLTGNYSVLHALGAPAFQRNNPPQRLAEIFSGLRQQRVDLTPLILHKPVLSSPPKTDGKGMLRLTGYYPTKPKRIQFDLTLEPVSGVWRLFGISVNAVPAEGGGTAKK